MRTVCGADAPEDQAEGHDDHGCHEQPETVFGLKDATAFARHSQHEFIADEAGVDVGEADTDQWADVGDTDKRGREVVGRFGEDERGGSVENVELPRISPTLFTWFSPLPSCTATDYTEEFGKRGERTQISALP